MAQPSKELDERDSLERLEERINRAVETVMSLREENASLRQRLEQTLAERDSARQEASKALEAAQRSTQELDDLRSERRQVRSRIEKLLGQMDLLSNA